jgi:hypothetical protein
VPGFLPENQEQQATVASFIPAPLRGLDQLSTSREVRCNRSLTSSTPRPCFSAAAGIPFFRFFVRLAFCREFTVSDAQETA